MSDDNTHHPKPTTTTADLATAERWRDAFRAADAALRQVERERDEADSRLAGVRDAHQRSADAHMKWKARAEKAEQERDTARSARDEARHEWAMWRDQARAATDRLRESYREERGVLEGLVGDLRRDLDRVERERDEWKARAEAAVERAEAAERERDEAREGRHEACRVARSLNVEAHQATKRAESAERELDEARDDDRLHSWGQITRHPFFDSIQFASGELTDAMLAALDEAHQPAPAVSRDEVWRVVAAHDPGDDELSVCRVNRLTDAVCALFGVEAEPADPVTEKARELAGVMHEAIKDERVEWHTAPAAVDVMAARLAAHVLGQEDRHVDQ